MLNILLCLLCKLRGISSCSCSTQPITERRRQCYMKSYFWLSVDFLLADFNFRGADRTTGQNSRNHGAAQKIWFSTITKRTDEKTIPEFKISITISENGLNCSLDHSRSQSLILKFPFANKPGNKRLWRRECHWTCVEIWASIVDDFTKVSRWKTAWKINTTRRTIFARISNLFPHIWTPLTYFFA